MENHQRAHGFTVILFVKMGKMEGKTPPQCKVAMVAIEKVCGSNILVTVEEFRTVCSLLSLDSFFKNSKLTLFPECHRWNVVIFGVFIVCVLVCGNVKST